MDLRRPLPFEDGYADAVYHSHLLEHFDPDEGARFLADNARLLRSGGILRVVVPDLEKLCRWYLSALDAAMHEGADGATLYEWSHLDLLDQMVRRRSCGRLLDFVRSIDLTSQPEIAGRLTYELQTYAAAQSESSSPLRRRLKIDSHVLQRIRERLAKALVRVIAGGRAAKAFDEGLFRSSGEVHHWMYDSYSLRMALTRAGLVDIRFMTARESGIPGFAEFGLDTIAGRVRRPGSLFAEGRKP